MGIMDAFNFKTGASSLAVTIPNIYPLSCQFDLFVKADLKYIYTKILTDVVQRTQGIGDKIQTALWDNCLESEASKGLISLIAEAMVDKAELCLTYRNDVLRKATQEETAQIKSDYKASNKSSVGVFISFKSYDRTDMLKIYSGMEYAVLNSLNKSMNLSKAIQLKMANMRKSVGGFDSAQIVEQAKAIATGLSEGEDVLLDKEDAIETSTPEMSSTEQAIRLLDAKRAFFLSMPISYVTGLQTSGIGSTGEADTLAVERGLAQYYVSIIKPVMSALFRAETKFKSQNFRLIGPALEAAKTFELISDDHISHEQKGVILRGLLDLEEDAKKKDKVEKAVKEAIAGTDASAAGGGANVQQLSLNGAQVVSLVGIMEKVGIGIIPKQSAKAIIKASFNIADSIINSIVDPMEEGGIDPAKLKPQAPATTPGGEV